MSHTGNKYHRTIFELRGVASITVDVYRVLIAFGVTMPGAQHAIKKILCAGLREKNTRLKDTVEAIDALLEDALILKQHEQVNEGRCERNHRLEILDAAEESFLLMEHLRDLIVLRVDDPAKLTGEEKTALKNAGDLIEKVKGERHEDFL